MAEFKNNPEETTRLDFQILRDGGSRLYWKKKFLYSDLEWFEKEHYECIQFKCRDWSNDTRMHQDFKSKLYFPDYYGMNLNALDDCLYDLTIQKAGIVLVFENLDSIKVDMIETVLDTFLNHSSKKMLFGQRMIVLAQFDDPNIEISPIGGSTPRWNDAEWFNSNRES